MVEASFPGPGPSEEAGILSGPLSRGWKGVFRSHSEVSASRGSKSSRSLSSNSLSSLPTGPVRRQHVASGGRQDGTTTFL